MSEVPVKPWWQSKTIWANVAAIAAVFAASKGIPVEPEMIAAILMNIASMVGRAVANKKIGVK